MEKEDENEKPALPVAVWLQKGDQFGWLKDYRRADPGHEGDLPVFCLSTNAFDSKIIREFDEDAKEMLRWLFHHGWVLRVCGRVDRRHWIGDGNVDRAV